VISENSVDIFLKYLLENNMKHIAHFMEKYDDVAEALKTAALAIITTGLILGLAPALMIAQASNF